jgi:hypothetical protein
MNKFFLVLILLTVTLTVFGQNIPPEEMARIREEAHKAGNDAYANAMIRNVLIIAGVAVVYFLFKSSSKKTDKKD